MQHQQTFTAICTRSKFTLIHMDVLSHLHRESSPAMQIKPLANQSCSRGAGLDVGHAGSVAMSLPSYIQWITQKLKVLTQVPVCMSLH